jgi:hypothetical protein
MPWTFCKKPSLEKSKTVRQPVRYEGGIMATQKQRAAARRNIKKAAAAAKRKQTLKHLPKKTRRALGQQAAKVRKSRRAQ